MNDVILSLTPHKHPYGDEPRCRYELWGKYVISAKDDAGSRILVKGQWNLETLVGWVLDQRDHLFTETLHEVLAVPALSYSKSTAQQLDDLEELEFETEIEQDKHLDLLFEFRERHSLRLAMPGCRIPEILIAGIQGAAEISTIDGKGWSQAFEPAAAQKQWETEMLAFLQHWPKDHPTAGALMRRFDGR